MTNYVTPVAVKREYQRVLRLVRWLHPSLAKEVLRLAYAEAQRRERQKYTTMVGKMAECDFCLDAGEFPCEDGCVRLCDCAAGEARKDAIKAA